MLATPASRSAAPLEPPASLGTDVISEWALDPSIDFLNHGCFGARPKAVCRARAEWQARLEARPIELLERQRSDLLEVAKAAAGEFLGMAPADFGLVTNATGAINAVLRSLDLGPGDEILTTNHVYNAVRQTLAHVARRGGAQVREIDLSVPLQRPEDVAEAIGAALGEWTRLVLIDHITSPTALLFPIETIVSMCAARSIDVLIDGAHAPGIVDLDIASIGAAYYAGNLHKWLSAPMGSAFLWVRPDRQAGIHPTTISHFYERGLAAEFAWQGTRDVSGWLAVPAAIEYFAGYGWDRVMDHNHRLAVWMQKLLAARWQVPAASPIDGSMIGSMATVPLPGTPQDRFESPEAMQRVLYDRHRIEVPIVPWSGRWWIRPCCHVYNRPEQYERLADVVLGMLT
jgi:isopenicillin-N epimerase